MKAKIQKDNWTLTKLEHFQYSEFLIHMDFKRIQNLQCLLLKFKNKKFNSLSSLINQSKSHLRIKTLLTNCKSFYHMSFYKNWKIKRTTFQSILSIKTERSSRICLRRCRLMKQQSSLRNQQTQVNKQS